MEKVKLLLTWICYLLLSLNLNSLTTHAVSGRKLKRSRQVLLLSRTATERIKHRSQVNSKLLQIMCLLTWETFLNSLAHLFPISAPKLWRLHVPHAGNPIYYFLWDLSKLVPPIQLLLQPQSSRLNQAPMLSRRFQDLSSL